MRRQLLNAPLLQASLLLLLGCPSGGTTKTDSGDSNVDSTSTTTGIGADQDVTYTLSDAFDTREFECSNVNDPDWATTLAELGLTQSDVNEQVRAIAIKWDESGTADPDPAVTYDKVCEAVLTDIESPVYAPPVGDCPDIVGTTVKIKAVPISQVMNGAQDGLAAAASFPTGYWCQVSLIDATYPENILWALMFAFNHYKTPAIVTDDLGVSSTVRSLQVRIPQASAGSFQQLMSNASAVGLVNNYPTSFQGGVVRMDYNKGGGLLTLGGTGTVVPKAQVLAIVGSSGLAIIDPIEEAEFERMDGFLTDLIETFGPELFDDQCVTGTEGDADAALYEPADQAYSDATEPCR